MKLDALVVDCLRAHGTLTIGELAEKLGVKRAHVQRSAEALWPETVVRTRKVGRYIHKFKPVTAYRLRTQSEAAKLAKPKDNSVPRIIGEVAQELCAYLRSNPKSSVASIEEGTALEWHQIHVTLRPLRLQGYVSRELGPNPAKFGPRQIWFYSATANVLYRQWPLRTRLADRHTK